MLRVAADESSHAELAAGLDEIVREGARRMLAAALEAEVEAYIAAHAGERDEAGRRLVVRNGHAKPRQVTTVAGAVEVRAPRVDDRRVDAASGQRRRFRSGILPPWCRRSPKVTEVLPLLYLHGLSSGDFVPALEEFFGSKAGLSASVITRLTTAWQDEQRRFAGRDLSGVDYVYVWVDGVHFNVRLDQDRVCTLVIVGVRADGKKELVALADGHRESTASWADLLRDCRRRGMGAPVLAVGDRALGFWAALREVFPDTREQRDWVHKIANVLDKLPKSLQPKAKAALHEMMNSPTKAECEKLVAAFVTEHEAKYPKATKALGTDSDKLMTHFDLPAEHWKHLRTTNPIESTFATVKLRQRVTKGAGSRGAGLAMAYRLLLLAERSWRRLDGHELLPLVRAGVSFKDGVRVERDDGQVTVHAKKRLSVNREKRGKAAA